MKRLRTTSHRPEFHRFELAWIVRNYLEEHNFSETLEKFEKEAGEALKLPKGMELAPQDVKSLRQVLEDYVAVKMAFEDRTRQFIVAKEKTQTLVKRFNKAIFEFYTPTASSSTPPNLPAPVLPRILRSDQQPSLRERSDGAIASLVGTKSNQKRRRKESSSHLEDSGGKTSPCPQTPPQIPSAAEHPPVHQYEEDRPGSNRQGEACESSSSPSSSTPSAGTRGTSASWRPLDFESPGINLSHLDKMGPGIGLTSEDKGITNFFPPELSEIDEILGQGLDSEELMNFVMSCHD